MLPAHTLDSGGASSSNNIPEKQRRHVNKYRRRRLNLRLRPSKIIKWPCNLPRQQLRQCVHRENYVKFKGTKLHTDLTYRTYTNLEQTHINLRLALIYVWLYAVTMSQKETKTLQKRIHFITS
jgi:hypothetical protein